MDIDIGKMFKDKNKEIFKNSLTLEMERNLEALKNTTDNTVALEINKLFLFFSKYFSEINIKYKKEELLGILYQERKRINDIVNSQIEEKKTRIKENYLEKETEEEILTKEFLEEYYQVLTEETKRVNESLDIKIKEEVCIEFFPKIIKKYKLDSIEKKDRINSRINILFLNNILTRIKEQTEFRDDSLKNMSVESFNKYLELNKSTIEK